MENGLKFNLILKVGSIREKFHLLPYVDLRKIVLNKQLNIKSQFFKKCPNCDFEWDSRESFLEDDGITIVGYQAHFESLTLGLLLFNHSCKTTLAVQAGEFRDLYDGPVFTNSATGSEACPGYCLKQHELRRCGAQCECAYVREIIELIKNWPKDKDNKWLRSRQALSNTKKKWMDERPVLQKDSDNALTS